MSKDRGRRATHWQIRSADETLPLWQRLAALAYADARANGHAAYHPGELARRMGKFDVTRYDHPDGPMVPRQWSEVSRAIRTAVDRGWLEQGSGARCLIVPLGQEGEQGEDEGPCLSCDAEETVLSAA